MTDQEYARRLLEHRQHGYSIKVALRFMRKRYILSGSIFAVLVLLICFDSSNRVLWVLAGMYVGMFVRDFGWFRGIKKAWPFSEKITDWEKVEAIANGGDCQPTDGQVTSESVPSPSSGKRSP